MMLRIDIHRWFAMVLGIGWNFPEILSDMCTRNFEAYKFQNGRRCHKKREQFKVLGIGWYLIEMLYGIMW